MRIPGMWTRDNAESQEQFVRRLKFKKNRGYVGVAMTSVLDLYEQVDSLQTRVAALERKLSDKS